jgi:alkylhydroperoxidase family enzyme
MEVSLSCRARRPVWGIGRPEPGIERRVVGRVSCNDGGVSSRGAASTADQFATVLAGQPAVLDALSAVHDRAWEAVDPDLLELCRVHIALLLGHHDEAASDYLDPMLLEDLPSWATSRRFSPAHRACLAFTEQFVIDVSAMSDDLVAAVADALGADGLSNFANALLVVEQRQRLTLAWSRLFGEGAS